MFNEDGSNGKRKLNECQKEHMKKDPVKVEFARKNNYKLLIIWEHDINNNNFDSLKELLV